ncbi:RNA polymerase sigma70 factor [Lysinibacillus contaminans]|uniref:RNA polymerase sigma70 factor n=1 Tax=Lysinibacillus contaminans TaxID=1293441 RepID=A0ABR5K1K1_9BACI|nr:sigma-70 family RNA polymerase sigma factor [Lysinibacillus contaminans]KOS68795.1 RNA polymerase sigma70 factor [Lysinibacillus contaminans]
MFGQSLLKKAQKGHRKSFLQLIEVEKVKLYKMAYVYMKNENDALDVVQETITRAYIKIESVKEEQYFSTWLMRILINTAVEMLRRNAKVIVLENEIGETRAAHLPIEDKLDLLTAIEHLEEKYKTVIVLRYYQDLAVKDIADFLNCPEGTVKTNLHRGIQKLKEFYEGGKVSGQGY